MVLPTTVPPTAPGLVGATVPEIPESLALSVPPETVTRLFSA